MQLIESYTPEYVVCFANTTPTCDCPACKNAHTDGPHITLNWYNEQRNSLSLRCESACREVLFNPDAFVLYVEQKKATAGYQQFTNWDQTLNQYSINLTINGDLTLEQSLYGIGVLISKAARLQRDHAPLSELNNVAEELMVLAENRTLSQQLALLPAIPQTKLHALILLGNAVLPLNMPFGQKMPFMLKISDMATISSARLQERLNTLEATFDNDVTPFLHQHPTLLLNFVLYQLYHHAFPFNVSNNHEQAFRQLTQSVFEVKMLLAQWVMGNNPLNEENVVKLISAYAQRKQNATPHEPAANKTSDLLVGLSLI